MGYIPQAFIRLRGGEADIAWFTPAGEEMSEQDWESGFGTCIVVFLNGEGITDLDRRGERVRDDSFLLCFNTHDADIEVTMPEPGYGGRWGVVLDTATGLLLDGALPEDVRTVPAGGTLTVVSRSLVALRRVEEPA